MMFLCLFVVHILVALELGGSGKGVMLVVLDYIVTS